MKNIERIIRYSEDDLTTEERTRFEDDLKQNPLLKQEYDAFLYNRLAMTPPSPPQGEGSAYFAGSVARMHQRISKVNPVFLIRPVYATFASAMLVVSLMSLINTIQSPSPQHGLLSANERRELESIIAGDENEVSHLNSNLLPALAGEGTLMDEDDYSEIESQLANSIAPTEQDRITVLKELTSSEELLATLSDDEIDDLISALSSEND